MAANIYNPNPEKGEDPDKTNEALSRAIAGASPTLVGLLMGASPASQMINMQATHDYYKNSAPQKLVEVVNPEGKHVYEDARNAVGMTPYEKPVVYGRSSSGSFAPKMLKDIDPKSPTHGQVVMGFFKGDHFETSDNEVIPPSFVEFKRDDIIKGKKDYTGSYNSDQARDPYLGTTKKIPGTGTTGLGKNFSDPSQPQVSEEEAKARIKSSAKGKDLIAKASIDEESVKSALNSLKTTNDPMVFSIALGRLQRLSVQENKMSDEEAERYLGNDYKDILTKASEYFRGKFAGQIPPTIRNNAINLAKYALDKSSKTRKDYLNIYSDSSGLGKQGQRALKNTSGNSDQNALQDKKKMQDDQLDAIIYKLQGGR